MMDVLRRESEAAGELSGLEQRLHSLQAEAAGQGVELAEARVRLGAEAARNEELQQQISCLGEGFSRVFFLEEKNHSWNVVQNEKA